MSLVLSVVLSSLARDHGVVVCMLGCWVHSREHLGSIGSSSVVGFACARDRVRWLYPESFGKLAFTLVVVGVSQERTLGVVGLTRARHKCHWCNLE